MKISDFPDGLLWKKLLRTAGAKTKWYEGVMEYI